jgi:uncharacterized protein (TIGR02391 family)
MTLPSIDEVLKLLPEELAPFVLKDLASIKDNGMDRGRLNFNTYSMQPTTDIQSNISHQDKSGVVRNIAEALMYLQNSGFIAPNPEHIGGGWIFVTRRGVEAAKSIEAFRRMDLRTRFPPTVFHEKLRASAYDAFAGGNYQQAVSDAFLIVEDYVRSTSRLSGNGASLMRAAFDADRGPLRSSAADKNERDSLAHLFAGAYGYLRNPAHHRLLPMNDPAPTVEQLMLASFLLREVDQAEVSP